MIVSFQEFFDNYRIKNQLRPNETVLNRPSMRLKREIRELKTILDILIGVDLPVWVNDHYYEMDEYVYFDGLNYRSRFDSNYGNTPTPSEIIVKSYNDRDLDISVEKGDFVKYYGDINNKYRNKIFLALDTYSNVNFSTEQFLFDDIELVTDSDTGIEVRENGYYKIASISQTTNFGKVFKFVGLDGSTIDFSDIDAVITVSPGDWEEQTEKWVELKPLKIGEYDQLSDGTNTLLFGHPYEYNGEFFIYSGVSGSVEIDSNSFTDTNIFLKTPEDGLPWEVVTIEAAGGGGGGNIDYDTYTSTLNQTTFTTSFNLNEVPMVFIEGLLLDTTQYTKVDNVTVELNTPLPAGETVVIVSSVAYETSKIIPKQSFYASEGQTVFITEFPLTEPSVFIDGSLQRPSEYSYNGDELTLNVGVPEQTHVLISSSGVIGSATNITANRTEYIVSGAPQSDFAAEFRQGFVDVYLNGIKLASGDFNDTVDGTISLTTPAEIGDEVFIIGFNNFDLANHYTRTEEENLLKYRGLTSAGTFTSDGISVTATTSYNANMSFNAVGDFNVVFAVPMKNENYGITFGLNLSNDGTPGFVSYYDKTVNGFKIRVKDISGVDATPHEASFKVTDGFN
jgi:hypothetical protein